MADGEAAAVEVDEEGSFGVGGFFVFAGGAEGACCGEEVECYRAGVFADCGWDGELEGWSRGQGEREVAVEPGDEVGEETVAARFFGEVGSGGDRGWCGHSPWVVDCRDVDA